MQHMIVVDRSNAVAGRSNPGLSELSDSLRFAFLRQLQPVDAFPNAACISMTPDDSPIQSIADPIRKPVDLLVKQCDLEILNVVKVHARLRSALNVLLLSSQLSG